MGYTIRKFIKKKTTGCMTEKENLKKVQSICAQIVSNM